LDSSERRRDSYWPDGSQTINDMAREKNLRKALYLLTLKTSVIINVIMQRVIGRAFVIALSPLTLPEKLLSTKKLNFWGAQEPALNCGLSLIPLANHLTVAVVGRGERGASDGDVWSTCSLDKDSREYPNICTIRTSSGGVDILADLHRLP
jgi:hypothetical protein